MRIARTMHSVLKKLVIIPILVDLVTFSVSTRKFSISYEAKYHKGFLLSNDNAILLLIRLSGVFSMHLPLQLEFQFRLPQSELTEVSACI